jgi:hypothetical protein
MSRRTRFALVSVLVMAVVCGLALFLLWPNDKPGVTAANFRRLSNGMTMEEADAILGPGKNISKRNRQWAGDRFRVIGATSSDGTVLFLCIDDNPETLPSRISGWLPDLLSPGTEEDRMPSSGPVVPEE